MIRPECTAANRIRHRLNPLNLLRRNDNVYCAANVLDIVESVVMAASFISSTVAHCSPKGPPKDALCVSGAFGLAGGMTGLASDALDIAETCGKKIPPVPPIPIWPTPRPTPAPPTPTPPTPTPPTPAPPLPPFKCPPDTYPVPGASNIPE